MNLATCIGCGCDDFHACPDGCYWLRVDYSAGLGVCSECEEHAEAWDRGDRTSHAEPIAELEREFAGEMPYYPSTAELAPKRRHDGRCDHNWPGDQPDNGAQCTRCDMSFIRYVFTECP